MHCSETPLHVALAVIKRRNRMNDIYGMRCRMGYGSQFHMLLCGPFLKWISFRFVYFSHNAVSIWMNQTVRGPSRLIYVHRNRQCISQFYDYYYYEFVCMIMFHSFHIRFCLANSHIQLMVDIFVFFLSSTLCSLTLVRCSVCVQCLPIFKSTHYSLGQCARYRYYTKFHQLWKFIQNSHK